MYLLLLYRMFKILTVGWEGVGGKQYFYLYKFILEKLFSISEMQILSGEAWLYTDRWQRDPQTGHLHDRIPSSIKNISYSKTFI